MVRLFPRVFTVAFLALVFVLVPGSTSWSQGASATTMRWKVKSLYKYKVQIAFYSSGTSRAWPGNGRAWALNDYADHFYTLSCRRGELICFGAWVTGDSAQYWGVGHGGQQGCTSCCYRCGTTPRPVLLR